EEHADEIEPAARRMKRDGRGYGYDKHPDWRQDVQRVVDYARNNQLSSEDLRVCAEQSWKSISDLFGPPFEADMDRRLDAAIETAIKNLKEIEEPKKGTQSVLEDLKKFVRARQRDEVVWADWVSLSKLEPRKDGEGLLDEVKSIAGDVPQHSNFQADVLKMIEGVFVCAGEALAAYRSFKEKQGLMDFMDQETMVLELARDNKAFRESMKDRLEQVMVDEFQDTSPIQLALFLELNELAGQSIWVGDPKQAIYSFRGTDPKLMDEMIKLIGSTQTLDKSWRSRERLVRFCNALFSTVFHEMPEDKVRLKIPEERSKKDTFGGWIESWNLPVSSNSKEALAIANGVKDMLLRRDDIEPGDIAVLCRMNNECERIADGLEALGIRASVAQGSLLGTKECQLALAALRYMQDERDTVALAEIVHLSHWHTDHDGWLATLVRDKGEAVKKWMGDPLIVALDEARARLNHLTPMEA
ncbi:MAG: UvrD-helicase domain-containing protein, partial [Actinomycetia bacterium]|nr:UvrD-helicase domain-containing protein [Actinomycetes bacterium]